MSLDDISTFPHFPDQVDIKNRNKALRALKIFFSRNTLITEDEFAPIWKGLFVTFWLSDKATVQQELADRIAKLIHSFTLSETCFLFIETFWDMLQREWSNIDKFRLDKFYSFIRLFLRETFVWLHGRAWTSEDISNFVLALKHGPFRPNELFPLGVRLHVVDCYLPELARATGKIPGLFSWEGGFTKLIYLEGGFKTRNLGAAAVNVVLSLSSSLVRSIEL